MCMWKKHRSVEGYVDFVSECVCESVCSVCVCVDGEWKDEEEESTAKSMFGERELESLETHFKRRSKNAK